MDNRLQRFICESLGKPWELMGRGPDSYDCLGFVRAALLSIDRAIPDVVYSSEVEAVGLLATCSHLFVVTEQPFIGAIVGMTDDPTGAITHVGVSTGNANVYHCLESRGVVGTDVYALRRLFRSVTFWRPNVQSNC